MKSGGVRILGPSTPQDRHALAAACLYGQPFGFTREDVDALHWSADGLENDEIDQAKIDRLRTLADRIASLLPPSDPQPWDYTPGAEKYEVSSNEGTPPKILPDVGLPPSDEKTPPTPKGMGQ